MYCSVLRTIDGWTKREPPQQPLRSSYHIPVTADAVCAHAPNALYWQVADAHGGADGAALTPQQLATAFLLDLLGGGASVQAPATRAPAMQAPATQQPTRGGALQYLPARTHWGASSGTISAGQTPERPLSVPGEVCRLRPWALRACGRCGSCMQHVACRHRCSTTAVLLLLA